MANGTATNVITGVGQVWIAPAGTAAPSLPSAHGATGFVDPTTPWVYSGFTESGVVLNVDTKINQIRVDEQSTPVGVTHEQTDLTIDLTFAEDTIANMKQAYGGGTITTVAAASGIPGQTVLNLSDTLQQVAIAIIGANNFDPKGRLVYIPTLVSGGKVKTSYMRAKGPRTYPATFSAVCLLSQIQVTDITAAAV